MNSNEIMARLAQERTEIADLENVIANTPHSKRTNAQAERLAVLKMAVRIDRDNYRKSIFAENYPVIRAEFEKYTNKPYGEKTKAKITKAIQDKTGLYVWVSRHWYRSKLEIALKYYDNIVVSYYEKDYFLSAENKILPFPENPEIDGIGGIDIIENSVEYAEQVMKKFYELRSKREALAKEISEFNNIMPSDNPGYSIDNFSYWM